MNDTNERSVASGGSVAGEPEAFAVVWENDERFDRYTVSRTEEAARRHAKSCPSMKSKVVPLYRAPTLTDAEREAIREAAGCYIADCDELQAAGIVVEPKRLAVRDALFSLLERMGGGK